jgi:hypothetical protein
MGDQADFGARKKREIRYSSVSFIFNLAICTFIVILPISRAQGIEGSVSCIWEERKREDEKKSEFTQIYDLILSRRLRPLYDASLKFEFRSETKEKEEDREKTQLLPSLNMRLGNEMTNLNMGWSKDIITDTDIVTGNERDYTHERAYMGFNWRPKWLPHILWQFQGHKRKESREEEPLEEESLEKDDRITFIEEYTLRFGPLTMDHNFDHEIRQIDGNETTNYNLEDRLYMNTGYELIQDRERENEDEDATDTWKHHVNFNITGHPADWIRPEYKAFWGDIKTDFPDRGETTLENDLKRETTLEHNLNLLFMPHPYFSSSLGMYYNRLDKSFETWPREVETFSFKMEPQIKGLIFDPNISMYPIMTSILMSSSTERSGGSRESRTLSFLFTGATTIYQGMDLDLDLSVIRWRNYKRDSKRLEKRVDSYLKLDLLHNLKGSISQKAKWTENEGENIEGERRYFEGDIDTRIIYRPIGTFMLNVAYMVDYDDRYYSSSWQYSINWRPAPRMEVDLRYQSRSEERDSYFLGELDLYMTHTIHLELRYQSPSDDQRMKVEFTLRF